MPASCQRDGRPKVIGRIRQKKLAAREHVRAVVHCLSHLQLDLSVPRNVLRPINIGTEARGHHEGVPFLYNTTTGYAKWDAPCTHEPSNHLRVVIGADEGSPLFSACMFLHSKNVAVRLVRDELILVCNMERHSLSSYLRHGPSLQHKAQVACILPSSHELQRSDEAYFISFKRYSFGSGGLYFKTYFVLQLGNGMHVFLVLLTEVCLR